MNLYDEVVRECEAFLKDKKVRRLKVTDTSWPDVGNDNMIFQKDMAFMLGGGTNFQTSAFAVTEDQQLAGQDEIILIGPDLLEIRKDASFSRLTLVRVKQDALPADDKLYNRIRDIEFTKYHVSPEGYMLRISSGNGVESVRVSQKAIRQGLNFEIIGNMYRAAYHRKAAVEAVKTVFITDPDFDYAWLKKKIKRVSDITKTIDHIYQQMSMMDCEACSLQVVCNEVEGLRELHFSQGKKA